MPTALPTGGLVSTAMLLPAEDARTTSKKRHAIVIQASRINSCRAIRYHLNYLQAMCFKRQHEEEDSSRAEHAAGEKIAEVESVILMEFVIKLRPWFSSAAADETAERGSPGQRMRSYSVV